MTDPRDPSFSRIAGFVAIAVVGFAAASVTDRPVYDSVGRIGFTETDLYRMFRVVGYLPVWLLVAAALVLVDSGSLRPRALRAGMWRGVLLVWSVVAAALACEILKVLLRRERPDAHAGSYVFRGWNDAPFSSAGLALPSSHAAVAFGAAWLLCRLHPQAAPIWLLLAVGCGATRVLAQKHFVSDVFLSATASYVVVWLIWRWYQRRSRP